jgi:hypothetical protein
MAGVHPTEYEVHEGGCDEAAVGYTMFYAEIYKNQQ